MDYGSRLLLLQRVMYASVGQVVHSQPPCFEHPFIPLLAVYSDALLKGYWQSLCTRVRGDHRFDPRWWSTGFSVRSWRLVPTWHVKKNMSTLVAPPTPTHRTKKKLRAPLPR